MKAIFAVGDPSTAIRLLPGKAVLVSHAYLGEKPSEANPNPKRREGEWIPWRDLLKLLAVAEEKWCDSGAFTKWQQSLKGKKTITPTVDAWAAFIVENFDLFDYFLTLDAIGNASESMRNWEDLLKAVPPPMHGKLVPVYHEGDPAEHLAAYNPAARLVGLGRTKGRQANAAGRKATFTFYDEAFNAFPTGGYHFLGNCNPETIEPYPARSFDATSWQRNSIYAQSHAWPWNRVSKDTRFRAYIEAISGIDHRPIPKPEQLDLLDLIGGNVPYCLSGGA